MQATITPELTLQKLVQLNEVHTKTGNSNRPIGVDTLSMIFNTSFSNMLVHLEELTARQQVMLTFSTNNNEKRKRANPIVLVHLL